MRACRRFALPGRGSGTLPDMADQQPTGTSVPARFEGARIPDPGFAGDEGEADPRLSVALADYGSGVATYVDVLDAIWGSRLLVPVVAVADEVEIDAHGRAHDKTSDMATVLMRGADGRMALLAFTGLDALSAWQADARPVAVSCQTAARAAVQESAAALVVDVAGPVTFAIEGGDLEALGAGWRLARVGERTGWLRPADDSRDQE